MLDLYRAPPAQNFLRETSASGWRRRSSRTPQPSSATSPTLPRRSRAVAGEDIRVIEEGEAQLDAFSGEEFRMELRAALAAQRLRELEAMAARSRFRLSGRQAPYRRPRRLFFGIRLLLGDRAEPSELDERAWRYVDPRRARRLDRGRAGDTVAHSLCRGNTPRVAGWNRAHALRALVVCCKPTRLREYARRMDPALAASRVPSQPDVGD